MMSIARCALLWVFRFDFYTLSPRQHGHLPFFKFLFSLIESLFECVPMWSYGAQLRISQHGYWKGFGTELATCHFLNQWWPAQKARTFESISIRHRFDARVSDRCLIDVDPMFSPVWVVYWRMYSSLGLIYLTIYKYIHFHENNTGASYALPFFIHYGYLTHWGPDKMAAI